MSARKKELKDRGRRRREIWAAALQLKRCPNTGCQAMNSKNATQCWKCGAPM